MMKAYIIVNLSLSAFRNQTSSIGWNRIARYVNGIGDVIFNFCIMHLHVCLMEKIKEARRSNSQYRIPSKTCI